MMASGARIVFIGGRQHGFELLGRLVARGERIERVYALEEDAHERVRFDDHIAAAARRAGIPCAVRKRLTAGDVADIVALAPDLALVFGWRTILPPALIRAPRLGCFGVHDSLLPRYRGFAPTNWAVINRERETGVTLWRLDDDVDSGAVVAQRVLGIGPDETAPALYERVAEAAVELVLEHLDAIASGSATMAPQDHAAATYACARTPGDGLIDWNGSSDDIAALVRALADPYPGAYTYLDGRALRIWSARAVSPAPAFAGRIPGRVAKIRRGSGVEVLCGSGSLLLEDVELEGDARRGADEVIRSLRTTLGPTYEELYRRLGALEREVAQLRTAMERERELGVHA